MTGIGNPYATFARYSADLCLFVMVAECGQLSKAAELAGLSQPRLSQRMKSLEDSIGRQLLLRKRRGVVLTQAGMDLRDAIAPHLNETVSSFVRYQNARKRRTIVIQTDLAFASFRLLQVFPSLCAAFPSVGISLMTTQMPDLSPGSEVDILVRMEAQHDTGVNETLLFGEEVFTVCSPGFKERHSPMGEIDDIANLPLIDLTSGIGAPWFSWKSWLAAQGAPMMSGDRLAFDSYDLVIQAAEQGLGIALGWKGLVDNRLETGTLVEALPHRASSHQGYYVKVVNPNAPADVRAVYDWLTDKFSLV